MATRIHVIENNLPIEGVKVWVGSLVGTKLNTNAEGKVSFDLETNWQGYVTIYIELSDGTPVTSSLIIKEGNDHIVDLSNMTIPI